MAISRIIQTLAPRRSAILTFSRRFSARSDAVYSRSGSIRTYRVGVKLPLNKWSDSKEEKDDWYHWFLASSSPPPGGSKAAEAPTKGYRDPRILWTYPCGFCARLSVQEQASMWKRDELMEIVAYVKEQQKSAK